MHLRRAIFAVLGAILLAPGIHPQDAVTTPGEEIPGTRSFYFGHLVDRPEALSGVWEAPDGQGGAVAQKTSEIGLRIAIGVDTPDVFRLVFSQGGKLIFAGLGIGLALALILDRFLASYLFGIRASDPTTMFACSVLLVATAVGAIWIPAQRASRVDPIVALRVD